MWMNVSWDLTVPRKTLSWIPVTAGARGRQCRHKLLEELEKPEKLHGDEEC
jgi:hypothetical protein